MTDRMRQDNGWRRAIGYGFLAIVLGAAGVASAQEPANARGENLVVETFHLTNPRDQGPANEILTALRNIEDPSIKMFYVPSQNAIVMRGTPDQVEQTRKLLKVLDQPKKTYRLLYTVVTTEDGKRVGQQHLAMVVAAGAKTIVKVGSRLPILTGQTPGRSSTEQTQVVYLDIGLNVNAELDEAADGVRLQTKVEQSSVAEDKSPLGVNDPIIRQTLVEGTAILVAGRPVVLGSVDTPGSTQHLEVEVVMEVVH